jgi:hypothetical protein
MVEVPKLKKGSLGFLLDARGAMARLATAANQWCAAFDAGDQEALTQLGAVLGEAGQDAMKAFANASKAAEEEEDSNG